MSLVHEALEKAKREASAKTSRDLGLPETGQPFRARRAGHSAAVLAPAASLGVALIAVAVRFFGSPVPTSVGAQPALAPPVAEAPKLTASPPRDQSREPAKAEPSTAAHPEPAESGAANPTQPPSVAPPPDARPAQPASTAPPPPSFRRRTTLADGTAIELGGIAWSEEAPLAYLNGKLYVKGERVAGMRLERIERERVLLVGADGARLFLTLH